MLAFVAEGFSSRLSFGLIGFAVPLLAFRLGLSLGEIGLLASLNTAVALFLKPAMGWVADRVGCKRSFILAIVLRSLVSLLLIGASAPWHLYAVRSLHGVATALRDPSVNSLIADAGGKTAVASSFAWYQTAKTLAGSLGKSLAGLLLAVTASRFPMVFAVAFALSAFPLVAVVRYVSDADRTEPALPPPTKVASSPVLPFAGLGMLVSGTASMLGSLFPVLATEYGGLSEGQTGAVYLVTAGLALSGPVFGWLSDNYSHRLVLRVRSVANTLSSLVLIVSPTLGGFAVSRGLDDLGKAAFRPAWGAVMAHVASFDRSRRARSIAYLSMGEDAGDIAGPVVAGLLWGAFGPVPLLAVRAALAVITELYTIALEARLAVPGGTE
jgi:MFS family permease